MNLFLEVVGATVAAAIAAHEESGGSHHDRSSRRGASENCFKRVTDFDGQNWKEWNFQFKVALKERMPTGFPRGNEDETGGRRGRDGRDRHAGEQMARELFDFLAMTVKDDALAIIQGTTTVNGYEAWTRMVARDVPNHPATAVVVVMRVMSPQTPKGLKELGSTIETWELQLNALAKENDKSLSPRLKIAAFMQLLPNDIQDAMFQSTGTGVL